MDDWTNSPRWALVYGLNTYIIYLVLPVVVNNQRRCSFISSGSLSIDDMEQPYVALMFYMMLSSYMTHEELVETLGVEVPSGCKLRTLNDPKEVYTEVISAKSVENCRMFLYNLSNSHRLIHIINSPLHSPNCVSVYTSGSIHPTALSPSLIQSTRSL
jgi:hypothetical protein